MAEPATIIFAIVSAIISAMSTAYTIKRSNEVAEDTAEAADKAAKLDMAQLVDKQTQLNDQAARDKLQRQLQTERERSRLRVVHSAAGIEGVSSLSILNSALMQESADIETLEANRASGASQYRAEAQAVQANAQSRINEASSRITGGLASSMMIGASGAKGAYTGYKFGREVEDWRKGK